MPWNLLAMYGVLSFNEQSRGLLPNLQEGLRELDETEKEGAFWCKLDGTSSTKCDIRYHKAEGWTPSLDIAVDDLILEYFRWAYLFNNGLSCEEANSVVW